MVTKVHGRGTEHGISPRVVNVYTISRQHSQTNARGELPLCSIVPQATKSRGHYPSFLFKIKQNVFKQVAIVNIFLQTTNYSKVNRYIVLCHQQHIKKNIHLML